MTAWKVLILFKQNVCSSSKTSRRKILNVRHVTELICPELRPDLDRRKVNFGCYRLHRTATRNFILVNLTLGRTRKFILPPWYRVGGGLMEPLPRVMLQYFETILPSTESLWSSQQDEVYFMDGGAAGGLWRHSQWSLSWLPSWILLRIRNQGKTARITRKVTHE